MEALWATISWRKHTIRDASPYGNSPDQVEIHGSVDLGLLGGQTKTLAFSSRGHLTPVESEWGYKWDSYQVFIVSLTNDGHIELTNVCRTWLLWLSELVTTERDSRSIITHKRKPRHIVQCSPPSSTVDDDAPPALEAYPPTSPQLSDPETSPACVSVISNFLSMM